MDKRELSFIYQTKRFHASGGDLNTFVRVSLGVDSGVSIEDAQHYGDTRLCFAARFGWCSAINYLLQQGVDVHLGSHWTALHLAVRYNYCDAAVSLLDAGARLSDRTRSGWTALHIAASYGHTNICKLLLSRGASLDARESSGRDPEAFARHMGEVTMADFLGEVRAAGGWAKYVAAPRADLLALRRELPSLRERGRASPSTVRAHERLFLNTTLPDEVFARMLTYWRSSRDY